MVNVILDYSYVLKKTRLANANLMPHPGSALATSEGNICTSTYNKAENTKITILVTCQSKTILSLLIHRTI